MVTRYIHAKSKSVALQQFIKFGKGFLAKVAELEQVRTVELNQFA